jgi:hypothetical protein
MTNKKKISTGKINTKEMILEIGAEGGSLSIQRFRTPEGKWKFIFITNESAMADFLDEEDQIDLFKKHPPVDTFEAALQLLNEYPWHKMHVLTLHHDYAEIIQTEKQKRSTRTNVWVNRG